LMFKQNSSFLFKRKYRKRVRR